MTEEQIILLESIRNMFLGMQMDPTIPTHAKEALKIKGNELDFVILDELENQENV